AIPKAARVNDRSLCRRVFVMPIQIERNGLWRRAIHADQAQLAIGKIKKMFRVAAPGWGVGCLMRDLPRFAGWNSVRVNWTDPQDALGHKRNGCAVRRIDRAVLSTGAQRLKRSRLGIGQRMCGQIDGEDLACSLAETSRVRLDGADRDRFSIRRPTRLCGLEL